MLESVNLPMILFAALMATGSPGPATLTIAGTSMNSGRSHGFALLRHTLPGYAIAVIASTYILATFGRIAGLDIGPMAMAVAVLAFPASIGAAIARIVV